MGDYKFGVDNRTVTVDGNNKIIYPSLSNIKGFGKQVAETLYEMGKNKYNTFIDILIDLHGRGINRSVLVSLIMLDYFSQFGRSQYLLDVLIIYDKYSSCKQINKNKLIKLNLDENILRKYSSKETESLYKEINIDGLIQELIENIENKDIQLKEKLKAELELLGYISTKIETLEEDLYYVLKIDEYKNKKSYTYYPTFYNIKNGTEIKYKVNDYLVYMDYPFKVGDIIKIEKEHKQNKKKLEKDTGKWIILKDEFNNHVDEWTIY